ncbi:hypothetical protein, partial [Shigella sonnei]|uniref:hypothetical protein n=5 Tax=Shigella sonnei TaxID=624 RepID=UPI0009853E4D
YPTREYQRDSPSDLLLRRPQGIKPKKKIVKIRDSGLTRKVISAFYVERLCGEFRFRGNSVHPFNGHYHGQWLCHINNYSC